VPFLVDSDWFIDLLKQLPEARQLLDPLAPEGLYISVVTYMEAFQGTLREPDPEEAAARLRSVTQNIRVILFDEVVAERCAWIREQVRGGRVRPNRRGLDLIIAATAIEHGLTLVTRQTGAYKGARVKLFNPWGYAPADEEEADWRQAAKTGPLWLKNLFVRA